MGVDFFPCDYCGTTICDCGRYYYCRDICERRWCSHECAGKDGHRAEIEDADDPNDYSCNFCRNEDVEDYELFRFLMKKHELTREEVVRLYLKDRDERQESK